LIKLWFTLRYVTCKALAMTGCHWSRSKSMARSRWFCRWQQIFCSIVCFN